MNRCAVPLIEIVSEPDIRSADEAVAYMQTLKSILEYLDVCDCKMQEGSLRCDVNLSVRPRGQKEFGTRTETKNLNSFKAIHNSIEFEIKRQIEEVENGGKIYQETRRWDDAKGIGYAMRTKEDAHDYRYFPEPDLAPIILSDEYIQNLKDNLPEMPHIKKERYMKDFDLPEYDADILTSSIKTAKFFEEANDICNNPKAVSNWIMGDFTRMLNEKEIEIDESKVTSQNLAELITLIDKGTISSKIAKQVFEDMFETGENAKDIVEKKGLVQMSDEGAIKEIVQKVVDANPQSIADYKAGKDRAIGFLVGQIMKETKGKANPQIVNKLLLEIINK